MQEQFPRLWFYCGRDETKHLGSSETYIRFEKEKYTIWWNIRRLEGIFHQMAGILDIQVKIYRKIEKM